MKNFSVDQHIWKIREKGIQIRLFVQHSNHIIRKVIEQSLLNFFFLFGHLFTWSCSNLVNRAFEDSII